MLVELLQIYLFEEIMILGLLIMIVIEYLLLGSFCGALCIYLESGVDTWKNIGKHKKEFFKWVFLWLFRLIIAIFIDTTSKLNIMK